VKECQRLNEVNKENCPTLNPMNKRSKLLSKKSRCTSKQLNAYLVEKHEVDEKKKKAYEWAVKEVVERNVKTAAEAARRATELFDIQVLADTIRKLIKSECIQCVKVDQRGKSVKKKWEL
jgi:superfamily II DNA helicase RecQ